VGIEANLKGDKRGLALAGRRLAAQILVVVLLLMQFAHNMLIWARQWLAAQVARLREYGIVRSVQEVWAIPERLKLNAEAVQRVRLCRAYPRARDVCGGFRPLEEVLRSLSLLLEIEVESWVAWKRHKTTFQ
jgi:hypothetical protein